MQDNTQSFAATTRTVVTANECGAIVTNFIPLPQFWGAKVPSPKEEKMYDHDFNDIEFEDTDAGQAKEHLRDRAHEARSAHVAKLREHYHLEDDPHPKSPAEFVKRIQDGQFVFQNEKTKDDPNSYSHYWHAGHFLSWRDPARKANMDGYSAALDRLDDRYQSVMDEIIVNEPAAGLRAFNSFKAADFTVH